MIFVNSDQTLLSYFNQFYNDAKTALSEMGPWGRAAHIFWLLGPFILLIERSPADLWLTVLALSFAIRAIVKKDTVWLRVFWVRAAFAFWVVTIISALASRDPAYAFGEAVIWFRFPLFAMATVYWLAVDKRLLYAMLLSTFFGLLVMCGILSAELLIEGQKGGRLMWPYGDLVPGNYVAKVGLPVFVVMVALAVSARPKIAAISGVVSLFTLVISIMTGERINFLIRACGGMLAALMWRPNFKRYFVLVAIEVLAVVIAFQALPSVGNRYVDNFVSQLPFSNDSAYFRIMNLGMDAFHQSPYLGIGTGNFRNMCPEFAGESASVECHPHPHNYYVQMLAETGIIGLFFGVIFLGAVIWFCFRASFRNRDNVVLATAWVVPFGLFWPIASSADFFGQWNNIFMWSAVALALAASNLQPSDNVVG